MSKNTGEIIQVVGVVVDAEFGKDLLPAINDAMKVKVGDHEVTLEVAQHLSETTVRAISLSSTDESGFLCWPVVVTEWYQ